MNRTDYRLALTSSLVALLLVLGYAEPAPAQHDHGAAAGVSPHAGMQAREIKALSDTLIRQYRSGEGMGLALAAELNHYPGPRHVLELADSLALSAAQRRAVTAARETVSAEARRLGERIIAAERELDQAFTGGALSEARLRELVAAIAALQGELRFTHLRAHLEARAALTPDQVRRYDQLRGYGAAEQHHHD